MTYTADEEYPSNGQIRQRVAAEWMLVIPGHRVWQHP
jgi:hypothetical protein